jgi:hypothetical protein
VYVIALGKPQAIISKDDENDMEDDHPEKRSKKLSYADGNNTSKIINYKLYSKS